MSIPRSRLASVERRLEELEETIEVLSDKKLLLSIERGLKDLKEGRYKKYSTVDALFADIEPSK